MKTKKFLGTAAIAAAVSVPSMACTGITLNSKDGTVVLARTIEWAGSKMNNEYVIVPRGYQFHSFLPDGSNNGLEFSAKYGFVGLAVEKPEFVVEGLNEAGLQAGLFYFPDYGQYEPYDSVNNVMVVADFQLVSWMLAKFKTIEEVEDAIMQVYVTSIDPRASTVHWRIADATGRQVVLEFEGGIPHFYENKLGVLTNSPGFEWHMTNLNNYVNLHPGMAAAHALGTLRLKSIGGGSGLLGLPGDATPPSRFVRAAFYQASAPVLSSGRQTVVQAFHLLNNFDIPVGIQYHEDETPVDMPSATQFTVATDMKHRKMYYRTMYNSAIRCIDLTTIDFDRVRFQYAPLDKTTETPVQVLKIK